MLPWLSLLLWCGACRASQMYGAGRGSYCSVPESSDSEITAIRVYIGVAGLIKGIELKQGPAWSATCGGKDGIPQEFALWPGEHITSVYGSSKSFFRYLVFYTDLGRWVSFGQEAGRTFAAAPDQPGKVLTGVSGQHSLLGLTGLGFIWGYPLVQLSTPSTNSTSG
ncbi:PREDICTED: zymogen granule membrane protein 16 [Condylura cristata]|uniref:zymogen granule membrane protein 16 n=1 Tax=Condylura cristata TaxID=143302 RepID=UPI00033454FA|nr:PREDICTED: zymogen granule membrane protein 16 [Condylura cristata]